MEIETKSIEKLKLLFLLKRFRFPILEKREEAIFELIKGLQKKEKNVDIEKIKKLSNNETSYILLKCFYVLSKEDSDDKVKFIEGMTTLLSQSKLVYDLETQTGKENYEHEVSKIKELVVKAKNLFVLPGDFNLEKLIHDATYETWESAYKILSNLKFYVETIEKINSGDQLDYCACLNTLKELRDDNQEENFIPKA